MMMRRTGRFRFRSLGKVRHFDKKLKRGSSFDIRIEVVDPNGIPGDAVVPVDLRIKYPMGNDTECRGYHAASAGKTTIQFDVAPDDTPGMWTIQARELASSMWSPYTSRSNHIW